MFSISFQFEQSHFCNLPQFQSLGLLTPDLSLLCISGFTWNKGKHEIVSSLLIQHCSLQFPYHVCHFLFSRTSWTTPTLISRNVVKIWDAVSKSEVSSVVTRVFYSWVIWKTTRSEHTQLDALFNCDQLSQCDICWRYWNWSLFNVQNYMVIISSQEEHETDPKLWKTVGNSSGNVTSTCKTREETEAQAKCTSFVLFCGLKSFWDTVHTSTKCQLRRAL